MSETHVDMKRWLSILLSELHRETLKPRGFRKEGKTFVRDHGVYRERYNFQGSSWNGTGVKWRFYLNVGLEFLDLEPERYWSYFAHTHWAARLDTVVGDAPAQWDYSPETDRTELKQNLGRLIDTASEHLVAKVGKIREQYVAKRKPRPTGSGV
jgi:hypothetical protein